MLLVHRRLHQRLQHGPESLQKLRPPSKTRIGCFQERGAKSLPDLLIDAARRRWCDIFRHQDRSSRVRGRLCRKRSIVGRVDGVFECLVQRRRKKKQNRIAVEIQLNSAPEFVLGSRTELQLRNPDPQVRNVEVVVDSCVGFSSQSLGCGKELFRPDHGLGCLPEPLKERRVRCQRLEQQRDKWEGKQLPGLGVNLSD